MSVSTRNTDLRSLEPSLSDLGNRGPSSSPKPRTASHHTLRSQITIKSVRSHTSATPVPSHISAAAPGSHTSSKPSKSHASADPVQSHGSVNPPKSRASVVSTGSRVSANPPKSRASASAIPSRSHESAVLPKSRASGSHPGSQVSGGPQQSHNSDTAPSSQVSAPSNPTQSVGSGRSIGGNRSLKSSAQSIPSRAKLHWIDEADLNSDNIAVPEGFVRMNFTDAMNHQFAVSDYAARRDVAPLVFLLCDPGRGAAFVRRG